MGDGSADSVQLQGWLDRMQRGDLAARDELLRHFCLRLERLARKMLHRYPGVQRWVQTDDVLQNALVRLFRALQEVRPGTVRQFFGLAAEQMRRELIDLARHYQGPQGMGAHHASWAAETGSNADTVEPPAPAEDPAELERWCAFHEEVEKLPAEEREIVGLVFYHGWSQADIAALFQVDARTVRRRWQSVMTRLHRLLRGAEGPAQEG